MTDEYIPNKKLHDELEDLCCKRDDLEKEKRSLIEKTKAVRFKIKESELSWLKMAKPSLDNSEVEGLSYRLKNGEANNRRLREMLALVLKFNGDTYKNVAEKINCSPAYARTIVEKGARKFRFEVTKMGYEK